MIVALAVLAGVAGAALRVGTDGSAGERSVRAPDGFSGTAATIAPRTDAGAISLDLGGASKTPALVIPQPRSEPRTQRAAPATAPSEAAAPTATPAPRVVPVDGGGAPEAPTPALPAPVTEPPPVAPATPGPASSPNGSFDSSGSFDDSGPPAP
jgi:hypothetical protein